MKGHLPRLPRTSRSTRDRQPRASAPRSADRDRGPLPGATLHARRHREVRRQRIVRRRQCRAADPAAGPVHRRRTRRLGGHQRRREPRRPAAAARLARPCGASGDSDGAHRCPGSRQPDLRTRRTARLPAHVPADLRLRGPRRRRLHHLQHDLDHRRATHARVRSAAHARRVTRADHARGGRGRPAAGRRRCGDRPLRRDRPGPRTGRAFQGVRRGPTGQRHCARDAHGGRLARRGHRRDGGSGLPAGAARDTRAADRGDARGRADPAATAAVQARAEHPLRARAGRRCGDLDAVERDRCRAARRRRDPRREAALQAAPPRQAAQLPRRTGTRGRHRLARQLARDHRPPRARELGAPAWPHARDRARADRRTRARRVHLGARGGHQNDDRARCHALLHRQPDRPEHPKRTGTSGGRGAGRQESPRRRHGHGGRIHEGQGSGPRAAGRAGDRRKEHRHGDRTGLLRGPTRSTGKRAPRRRSPRSGRTGR